MTGLHDDYQDLLQFLYQCPIGIVTLDESGNVSLMNPAAARMITAELVDGESATEPMPILERLVPELVEQLRADPDRLGMISTGRGQTVDGRDGTTRFSVTMHRLRRDHVTVSLTDVTEERRLLNEQRARALRLQNALLGRVDATELEVAVAYVPAHEGDVTGGDWYDVIELGEGSHAFVVGDVVGHDIEASATMGQLAAVVRAFALIDADPGRVVERTDAIARGIDSAGCATLQYAVLDRAQHRIEYLSAGHPPPLLVRSEGTAELLRDGHRPALATVDDPVVEPGCVEVADGDLLVLYTDGLVERRGEEITVGIERLRLAGEAMGPGTDPDALIRGLVTELSDGGVQTDDLCVMAVRLRNRRH